MGHMGTGGPGQGDLVPGALTDPQPSTGHKGQIWAEEEAEMNKEEKQMKNFHALDTVVSVPDAKGLTGVVTLLGEATGAVTEPRVATETVTMGGGTSGTVREPGAATVVLRAVGGAIAPLSRVERSQRAGPGRLE